MNPTRRQLLQALPGMVAGGHLAAAQAQPFPSRPLRIVVPFAAGGVADLTARAVAQKLSESMGQPVLVDNRPGAGGVAAAEAVARAEPDGHTLLLMSNGTAVSASLFRSLPFDTQRDFAPVALLGRFDLALLVPGASSHATLAEFMARARAHPGSMNLGTINIGSTQHLAAELFKASASLDLQVVPFNGTPALMNAMRAGQVDAGIEILGPALPQIAARALRALAVLGERRSARLPDVPTLREGGVAGFNVSSWNALAAPARTPRELVLRLNREVRRALESPDVQRRLADLNVEAQPGPPEPLEALLASEVRRWAEVIRRANIPLQ